MAGKAAKVVISERQQEVLDKLSNAATVAKCLSQRAPIILRAFEGQDNETIASQVGLERHQVGLWRRRWQGAFANLVKIECLEPAAAGGDLSTPPGFNAPPAVFAVSARASARSPPAGA